jgi:hypothetical protein
MKVRAPRVCQLIKQGMSGQAKLTAETADNVRALEISRIDGIVMAHWPNRAAAKSADILLRASERRCKLLGLDAPTKLAPTTPDGKPLTPTVDLSKLTDDQLAQMEALYEAAGATLLPAEA